MRGVAFHTGRRVTLETLPDPRPGPGEVVIKIRASGICHTDIEILRGNYGTGAFPLIPGHEFAGEVVALGPDVTEFKIGDRTVADPNIGCGACPSCRAGRINLCDALGAYGVSQNGGFAEFCVIRVDRLHKIGDLPYHIAALAEPMGCVLNGLTPLAGRNIYRSVVFGAGPIGMLMALALRAKGSGDLVIVDPNPARRALAEGFGIQALPPETKRLDQLHHFDLAVDATGLPDVAGGLIPLLANGGAALFFGVCPQDARIEISPFELFRRQLSLFGTHSLNIGHIGEALTLLNTLGPQLENLVTHRLGLEDIAECLSDGLPEGAMKVHFSA